MTIDYKINEPVDIDRYIALLRNSGLGERRPMDDRECLEGMLSNSNLVVSAWDDSELVGIARSITDFHYSCYLSDLAVRKEFQTAGIGTRLQAITQGQLGPRCKLILIAAPEANLYYKKLGYVNNPLCWVMKRDSRIGH